MTKHDEYTDFSCSTSMERLARDVETLLRSWHLVGSDRHVSFAHAVAKSPRSHLERKNRSGSMPNLEDAYKLDELLTLKKKSNNSSTTQFPPSSSQLNSSCSAFTEEAEAQRLESLHRSSSFLEDDSDTGLHQRQSSSSSNTTSNSKPQQQDVRLIRSNDVTFTVSLAQGRASIPLTLALWDGPTTQRQQATNSSGEQETQRSGEIPHSLQRVNFTEMPVDTFGNFSFLFGIGQHITLSPISLRSGSVAHDVMETFQISLMKRHDATRTLPWVTVGVLSSMLQTALNCAASNCACRIPAFGLWGIYQPISSTQQQQELVWMSSHDQSFGFPHWMTQPPPPPALTKRKRIFSSKKNDKKPQTHHMNKTVCVSPLSASLGSMDQNVGATFWAAVLPPQPSLDTSLNEWGRLLLQHSPAPPPDTKQPVALWGARHVYAWYKPKQKACTSILFDNSDDGDRYREWRSVPDSLVERNDQEENVESYRRSCRRHAKALLERAWGASPEEPMWSTADDPLASVHVTVTWNGRKMVTWNGRKTEDSLHPLLLLPLRIRSRHAVSRGDLQDMQDSVERATLDPFALSTDFCVQTRHDREVSTVATLAASQRCVLAALIRTASLHPDTLLEHVTNEAVLDEWCEGEFDAAALEWIMQRARVGPVTRRLVEAMTWTDVADHMIEYEEAEAIVQEVVGQTTTLSFPSPPEQMFATPDPKKNNQDEELFEPLPKSAPVGRLVSVLFMHMSRLRAPSSMALVWLAFVKELRNRWYVRTSIPNMGPVPGLDPHPDDSPEKRAFSTIGVKADYAAFVHCSEPDPDDNHCLVGQRLQVFNICIESTTALELLEVEKLERKHAEEERVGGGGRNGEEISHDGEGSENACQAPSVASTEVVNNVNPVMSDRTSTDPGDLRGETTPFSSRCHDGGTLGIDGHREPIVDSTPPHAMTMVPIHEEGYEQATVTSGNTKLDYCDATEGRSLVTLTNYDDAFDVMAEEENQRDDTANVTQRQIRKGARCPVHGVSLVASGDQLYAPYLQRPNPLTDKTILERKLMLSHRRGADSKRSSDVKRRLLQDRLDLAQRLQKPKLLSDMRSFKAANPGAVFQDFTQWYGNPGNPLDEYKDVDEIDDLASNDDSANLSTAVKLDRASEAIQILNATRDFWSDTWDEAAPCAALEQEPLFDVNKTVEMVLHHLETMHPANLVNQIMAVNLSMSYFVLLASAEDAIHVRVVQSSLVLLREKTESALDVLSRDATDGAYAALPEMENVGRLPKHASSEAIAACESVCDALAEMETLLARASTLLHKFPQQYDLVQTMLQRAEGDSITLDSEEGRRGILNVIKAQQEYLRDETKNHGEVLPHPCLREYVLRNRDEENPCQLCVRFGDNQRSAGSPEGGALLLALSKCSRE